MNRQFTENHIFERMLSLTSSEGDSSEYINRRPFHTHQTSRSNKSENIRCWRTGGKTGILIHTAGSREDGVMIWELICQHLIPTSVWIENVMWFLLSSNSVDKCIKTFILCTRRERQVYVCTHVCTCVHVLSLPLHTYSLKFSCSIHTYVAYHCNRTHNDIIKCKAETM